MWWPSATQIAAPSSRLLQPALLIAGVILLVCYRGCRVGLDSGGVPCRTESYMQEVCPAVEPCHAAPSIGDGVSVCASLEMECQCVRVSTVVNTGCWFANYRMLGGCPMLE
jgi:hypothetical protein